METRRAPGDAAPPGSPLPGWWHGGRHRPRRSELQAASPIAMVPRYSRGRTTSRRHAGQQVATGAGHVRGHPAQHLPGPISWRAHPIAVDLDLRGQHPPPGRIAVEIGGQAIRPIRRGRDRSAGDGEESWMDSMRMMGCSLVQRKASVGRNSAISGKTMSSAAANSSSAMKGRCRGSPRGRVCGTPRRP